MFDDATGGVPSEPSYQTQQPPSGATAAAGGASSTLDPPTSNKPRPTDAAAAAVRSADPDNFFIGPLLRWGRARGSIGRRAADGGSGPARPQRRRGRRPQPPARHRPLAE